MTKNEKILEELNLINPNPHALVSAFEEGGESYYEEDIEVFTKQGIEIIDLDNRLVEQVENIEDGYSSIPVSLVIKFMDLLFKSDGSYGSYGFDYFGPWYEVEPREKVVIEYVKVTN